MGRAWPPTLLLALVAAAGCQSDSSSAPNPFTGDLWTLSGPEVTIGSVDDPEYVFGPVAALVPGPDGFLYSLHWQEGSIRRWSADGTPSGSVGREGEGPGEFRRPSEMGFFGDSLWVWDLDGYHVTYFDLGGKHLGRVSPEVDFGDFGGPEGMPPRPERPFRDGTFLGIEPTPADWVATGEMTEAAFTHMDAEGATLGTIWMHPYEPRDGLALLREGGGGFFGPQAFGDGAAYAVSDEGLLVTERRAWTGEGEAAFTLTRIGLAGDTIMSVRVPYTPAPLATDRIDSAVVAMTDDMYEFMSARQPGLARAALEARFRDATYKPAYVPPVRETMLAAAGNIWVRRFDPVELDTGQAFNEWWIMDADGAPLARALTPAGLQVRHIGADFVWGTEQDEFEVDYIVRYRLVKAS